MKKTLIVSIVAMTYFAPYVMATEPVQEQIANVSTEPVTGIQLGQTRVVIKPGEHTSYFNVISHDDRPNIVSAFILDQNEKRSRSFAVEPSVFQLAGRQKVSVRILQLESLPTDKESLFWLQVNSVVARPEAQKQDSSSLNLALGQRIKLFYRPKGLEGDARYAAESLKWHWKDGYLTAINPTKFWVSILYITINGKKYNISDMVQPSGNFKFKTPKLLDYENDGFAFIDEYGGEIKLPFNVIK